MIERIYFYSVIFAQKEMESEKHIDVVLPERKNEDNIVGAPLPSPFAAVPKVSALSSRRQAAFCSSDQDFVLDEDAMACKCLLSG